MDNNCNDVVSDVVKIFVLEQGKCEYAIPVNVRANQISPSLMGIADLKDFLLSQPFLTVSDTENEAEKKTGALYATIKDEPQVKVSASKGLSGLIFKLSASISVENPTQNSEQNILDIAEISGADYVFLFADGRYRLFRSIPGSSSITTGEDDRKERILNLRIDAQSVSGLISII